MLGLGFAHHILAFWRGRVVARDYGFKFFIATLNALQAVNAARESALS